jgi:hypothetical protein
VLRVCYELEDLDRPGLGALVDEFVAARLPRRAPEGAERP